MSKFAKKRLRRDDRRHSPRAAFTGRDLVACLRANPFYSFDGLVDRSHRDRQRDPEIDQRAHAAVRLQRRWIAGGAVQRSSRSHRLRHPRAGGARASARAFPRAGDRARPCARALVVFDEMISGFRFHLSGAQGLYGVKPDMATFGKAIANGFSWRRCAAGARDGARGLDHDRERVFLLSATHGAETHALAAAVAAIGEMRRLDVAGHVQRMGARLIAGVHAAARDAGLEGSWSVSAHDASRRSCAATPTARCRCRCAPSSCRRPRPSRSSSRMWRSASRTARRDRRHPGGGPEGAGGVPPGTRARDRALPPRRPVKPVFRRFQLGDGRVLRRGSTIGAERAAS